MEKTAHQIILAESALEPTAISTPAGENVRIAVRPGVEATIVDAGYHPWVELEVGEGARVQYILMYSGAGQMRKHARLAPAAHVAWRTALLGGTVGLDILTRHIGEGSSSDHQGFFIGRQRDRFAMNYWSEHTAKHTTGHIVVHGALFDRAYADFKGNIQIAQSAADTNGSLTEATLLLGDHARSDSVPQLEIDTNDVRAAHSSSMTRIDDEQLFYLQSRLIPTTEGKRMIVRGFLESIIDTFVVATIRREIYTMLDERIRYV